MPEQIHALVVDDSKSARLVLRRMLEKHGVIVDTVDSAAAALEFLIKNRPDVIFMDHMMPGMDGFEAVRAIKDNPQTATIPVMMHTSKGGDLYLGQARALGAVGVLPKTVAPAELYESLQRIGLLDERRNTGARNDENTFEHLEAIHEQHDLDIPTAAEFDEAQLEDDDAPVPAQLMRLLDQQRVEIRKDVLMGLDTSARQNREKLDILLDEKIDALRKQLLPPSVFPTVLLTVLLFASVIWNFASLNDGPGNANQVAASIAMAEQAQSTTTKQKSSDAEVDAGGKDDSGNTPERIQQIWRSVSWALNQDTNYPWDEIALDGARMELVAKLLDQLVNDGFTGKLVLKTHVGEFCLQGDQQKGFELAGDDIVLDKCSSIMNPVQPTDSPATHQSLAFANFVATAPGLQDGAISLEIQTVQRSEPLADYPPREPPTKAGEWNDVAAANNRIIIQLMPE